MASISTMKTSFVASVLLVVGLTGCVGVGDWRTVRGSGNVISETRQVSQFDQVTVSGSGELFLEQGDEESLAIEADDNLLPLIESDVHGGRLSLGPRHVNLRPTERIQYRLKVRNLRSLHLSGSIRGEAGTVKTDRLDLSISGSGAMQLAQLETGTFSTRISGSGSTSAAGHAQRQEIHISGSGAHHAPDLKCQEAHANISGSGDASLWVDDMLSARISGSGRIAYRGNAQVDSRVSGSGRIRHLPER